MDIEKAKKVEKLLKLIGRCDRLLKIWNDTVNNTKNTISQDGFALQYSTPYCTTYLNESLPEELNEKVIDLIINAKKEYEKEIEMM